MKANFWIVNFFMMSIFGSYSYYLVSKYAMGWLLLAIFAIANYLEVTITEEIRKKK